MTVPLLGKSPKNNTLFPKAKIPKSSKSASLFLGNRNPHFTGTPKNRIPKISSQKWFLGKSLCSGANPIILKRQTSVSSPKFSQILIGKQNHEITASRIQSVFTPETLYSLYFQGFFSPYPEKQNDLIERIFPLYKVVLLLLILFLGLPQIAFAGYSGVPLDNSDYSNSIVPGGLEVQS